MSFQDRIYDPERWQERRRFDISWIVSRNARAFGSAAAIVDLEAGGDRVSYAELDDRVSLCASALAGAGVRKHDLVALLAPNGVGFVVAAFGAARAGAVTLPFSPRLLAADVVRQIDRFGARALVCDERVLSAQAVRTISVPSSLSAVLALRGFSPEWEEAWARHGVAVRPALAQTSDAELGPVYLEDPVLAALTGGTTGRSKAVLISHVGMLFQALSAIVDTGMPDQPVTVLTAPLCHLAGFVRGLLQVLWRAGTVVVSPGRSFDARRYVADVAKWKATYAMIVPAMAGQLVRLSVDDLAGLATLRSVVIGSAPMPGPLREQLQLRLPQAAVRVTYGFSENVAVTILPPDELLTRPSSVGRPTLDSDVVVVDPLTGDMCPAGAVGEVLGRNAAVGLEYLDEPSDVQGEGWVPVASAGGRIFARSGDLGRLDEDGFLHLVDRRKDMVLSGGLNVYPQEVEAALSAHPAVAEVAVVGIPDHRWGEAVWAVVVRAPDRRAPDEAELDQWCRSRLAAYKCPKGYEFVSELPRTHMGKVLKTELRARLVTP